MSRSIYTIGHSTRTLEAFEALLQHYRVGVLIDIRTVPRSRHVPHFNSGSLFRALAKKNIQYRHLKALGGLRKPAKDSVNAAWRNLSFRGYADYMQTDDFAAGITELTGVAAKQPTAIMCAEAVPWRCHRSLVADALTIRGWQVRHILSLTDLQLHQLTPFAVVDGESVTYPQR